MKVRDRQRAEHIGVIISSEERRTAELEVTRSEQDVHSKKAELEQARLQVQRAETILRMHEIRAPVAGTLSGIYKQKGEAVRALEAVFQIRVAEE